MSLFFCVLYISTETNKAYRAATGLYWGHAYAVIGTLQLPDGTHLIRYLDAHSPFILCIIFIFIHLLSRFLDRVCVLLLFRIREPHGTYEWTGSWNDLDDRWRDATLRQAVTDANLPGGAINDDAFDGVFFMSSTDFFAHVDQILWCPIGRCI